jgi:hypothetical protein
MIKKNLSQSDFMSSIYTYAKKRSAYLLSFIFSLSFILSNEIHPTEKVISCEVMGGLGNQLFQIATTLATAWDHDYDPIFPELSSSPSYLTPRPVYWNTLFRNVSTQPEYLFNGYKKYPEKFERKFTPILLQDPHVKLTGYWQSEKYFSAYRKRLLELFKLQAPIEQYVEEKFGNFTNDHKGPVVSVHLRLGDYLTLDGFMCLWKDEFKHYYAKAISYFPSNTLFMVFSDDPSYAKEFFTKNFPQNQAVFPQDIDYVELYLMTKCNHNIIANSTFSWWGAYLNTHPDKIVISPKEWTVTKGQGVYFEDYLPKDWITISVLN